MTSKRGNVEASNRKRAWEKEERSWKNQSLKKRNQRENKEDHRGVGSKGWKIQPMSFQEWQFFNPGCSIFQLFERYYFLSSGPQVSISSSFKWNKTSDSQDFVGSK